MSHNIFTSTFLWHLHSLKANKHFCQCYFAGVSFQVYTARQTAILYYQQEVLRFSQLRSTDNGRKHFSLTAPSIQHCDNPEEATSLKLKPFQTGHIPHSKKPFLKLLSRHPRRRDLLLSNQEKW